MGTWLTYLDIDELGKRFDSVVHELRFERLAELLQLFHPEFASKLFHRVG